MAITIILVLIWYIHLITYVCSRAVSAAVFAHVVPWLVVYMYMQLETYKYYTVISVCEVCIVKCAADLVAVTNLIIVAKIGNGLLIILHALIMECM